jgi:hypothetical protein
MVRRVARAEAGGDWMARGKVSTGCIHGHRHSYLTRSKALDRGEEGGQQRCRADQCGRWRRSSTALKVPVLRVMEKLQGLAKLLDLCTGREEG